MLLLSCFMTCSLAAADLATPDYSVPTAAVSTGPSRPIAIEWSLAAASDYRFRGMSLSGRRPVIQPTITARTDGGLYASIFASTLGRNEAADLEVDLTAGLSREFGGAILGNVAATYYTYPGSSALNYGEITASAETAARAGTIGLTTAYAPPQKALGMKGNFYGGIYGSHPLPGRLSMTSSLGLEDGAFGNWKRDWSVGLSRPVGSFSVSATYVDTARTGGDRNGKSAFVISLSRRS